MFGPLPPLYRWRTVVVAVLVFIAAGAWLAHATPVPLVVTLGALLGGLAGVLVAFALLHDFSHRPRTVRVRRR
jgi:hypothetical protein